MQDREMRVRFAPSPTGPLHIGGARSALFNWLLAKHSGGKFILRVEDTDLERSSRESEEDIKESLCWLGLSWDEGIDVGGPHGPYRQTERLDIYREYTQKLLDSGQAYYCYCTDEELEDERQKLAAKGQMPRYMGHCRELTEEQKDEYEAQGRKATVRLRVPPNQDVLVDDLVRGKVVFDSNGIGDFVIVKSDGVPTYNYAVVIDDILMKVTHVVRGEEHLSNTPRQVLVYEAVGAPTPKFGHVSLILGKDRSKMSKRHGATSVEQYKKNGYLPSGLLNFLVLLGWSPSGEQEIFTLDELVKIFSLDHAAKNPAVFDVDKLNWINAQHIKKLNDEQMYELALPYLMEGGFLLEGKYERAWLVKVVATTRDHISCGAEIPQHVAVYFGDGCELENEEARAVLEEESADEVLRLFEDKVKKAEELTAESVQALLKSVVKDSGLPGKKVYMPIRVAISGQTHGPEMTLLVPLLGGEKILKRLAYAREKLKG